MRPRYAKADQHQVLLSQNSYKGKERQTNGKDTWTWETMFMPRDVHCIAESSMLLLPALCILLSPTLHGRQASYS